jgi:hypothetical protein
MKIQLETIPVWDAMKEGSECYLCDLKVKADADGVKYYLGPSVMNPETRVKVNADGFCQKHFAMLSEAGKPQGLGLMADTYLQATRDAVKKQMQGLLDAKPGKKLDKAVMQFDETLSKRDPHCLICAKTAEREERYLYTTAYLFGSDPDFKKALASSKGFCIPHYQALLKMSKEALDAETRKEFVNVLTEVELSNLERLQGEVLWMTQKYKSENFDKPWNGCEDAQKRVVLKLTGR